ncbi:hypothetical protein D0T25_01210 [Duganella sp. BJB488]|uniref:hypothetical protein n=1 Tax=unclassified Duganella TaxID=2636909 RepID=UPI000E34BC1E|nr:MULTISPECIES: hypothetical protein [unclassified Duganella]RFP26160.1 hypothetical protein D0T26_01995 [Duganella sp. BJB489]RFP28101.1 hypothetical protein D0T25_01210 [Duganella sp. BJB488]RFP37088.1 hypothetical protein D0T24_10375 [Duganella sp. BJB480]
MNDAASEQKQFFEAPLDSAEQAAVTALVNKHKANATFTQQLALDASRLVTVSQRRLAEQSEAGFFKRFANAISGKTSENQQLNQQDMLHMQKMSWHYLQQLQHQNLINSQGIAVIRNNLGMMNDMLIETRGFLEQVVDSVRQLQDNANFGHWALNIEANKRSYKSIPKIVLILRVAYDFIRSHPNAMLTEREISNYVVNTLEKLDVNCDEEVRLLDFISELIDQIEVVTIERYRGVIALSVEGHAVDSEYVQKNISGVGLNALYFLSDHYEKIADLIGDDELCNSDAAREKIISKFFGKDYAGLSTTYQLRHLIYEIIGGSHIAVELYKEEHGLNAVPDEEQPAEATRPEAVALVSTLPDIHAHTILDGPHSDESKQTYLLLLALCVENAAALNGQAREFIALLAEKSGHPQLYQQILALADHPRKQMDYQQVMQALLDDEDKKYTWLLDAFYLLTLAQQPIESPKIKWVIGVLKPAQLKECLPDLQLVLGGGDTSAVLDAAIKLQARTQGWKNVVRYRELRFTPYFAETIKRLGSASWAATRLIMGMNEVYGKAMEHSVYFSFSDGGLLDSLTDKAAAAVCSQGRKSALSGLNEARKTAEACLSEHQSALSKANGMISRLNVAMFDFDRTIPYSDFQLDNSADNEDWSEHFQRCYRQVEGPLEAFNQVCDDASEQLGFFVKGDFDKSVLKLREQRAAERERKLRQEKLEKQSVTIGKDGKEHLFSIDWQQVEHPPCDPDKISHIKTDGKVWVIVATTNSDEVFYRSEDGVRWQAIQIDQPGIRIWFKKIEIVNGTWIITNGELSQGTRAEGYYYSADALTWKHCGMPKSSGNSLSPENIMHFNGQWLWRLERRQEYRYIEKGIFSDSTKSGSYRESILYCAETLAGPWQPWERTPQLGEGVVIETLCSLPGKNGLLAFCKYDWSYIRDKKKPEVPPFVMYYGAAKAWQQCSWAGGTYFPQSPLLVNLNGQLAYFGSEVLVSDKGYEWRLHDKPLHVDDYHPLRDLSLFTSRSSSSVIYVAQDIKQFKELALDDGSWNHLSANEAGILGVYYANRHEETVLRLGRYICQARL